jgi:hypothetical protein
MTRPRTWKRTLLIVFLLLAGGAIINVAVAWGIALRPEVPVPFIKSAPSSGLNLDWPIRKLSEVPATPVQYEKAKATGFVRTAHSLPQNSSQVIDETREVYKGMLEDPFSEMTRAFAESQLRSLHYVHIGDPGFFTLYETTTGWPMPSLSGYEWEIALVQKSKRVLRFALELKSNPVTTTVAATGAGSGSFTMTQTRLLPLRPMWPGFAINTIFYAAILWLLWITPGKIRRFIRIRRGRCPACAYPVGTSPVCTECGTPVPSHL